MVLKISIAAAVAVGLVLSFLTVRTNDDLVPAGTTVVFAISDPDSRLDRHVAKNLIEDAARQSHLIVSRSVSRQSSEKTFRTLFTTSLDASGSAAQVSDYSPTFSRSIRTTTRPFVDIANADILGLYVSDGDPAQSHHFARLIAQAKLDVKTTPWRPIDGLTWTAEKLPVLPFCVVSALGLLLGVSVSTFGARRATAVWMAHGGSRSIRIARLVTKPVLLSAAFGLAGLGLSVPVLAAYNGLVRFAAYAGAVAVATALIAAIGGMTAILVCLLELNVKPASALGRSQPLQGLAVLTWLVHFTTVVLVLSIIPALVATSGTLNENRRDASDWADASVFSSVTIRASDREFDASMTALAGLGRGADQRGAALISTQSNAPVLGTPASPVESMVVNHRFLNEQAINDENGRRVTSTSLPPSSLAILIPSDLWHERASIMAEYRDWLGFQSSTREGQRDRIPVRAIAVASGQRIFDYDSFADTGHLVNPVVAVLPGDRLVVSDDWLASTLTTGGVLFSDRSALREAIQAEHVQDIVGSIESVGDAAAVRASEQARLTRVLVVIAALETIVMLTSASVLALAVATTLRRADLVREVHGISLRRRFLSIWGPISATNLAAFSIAILLWPELPKAEMAQGLLVIADGVIVSTIIVWSHRWARRDRTRSL
jgi:hypothetical protein